MKRIGTLALIVLGFAFVGGGVYSVTRGLEAKEQVRRELMAQKIKTPADASIPGSQVDDARTAKAMGDIIDVHSRKATGGKTYSELGRYAAVNGDAVGTNDEAQAVIGANGRPVANPLRGLAFEASALRTSLYTSVMAFNVADLVIGLGFMMVAIGGVLGAAGLGLRRLPFTARPHRTRVDLITATPAARQAAGADHVAAMGS